MIVDLLRNDLSRVARPGSVEVPELFAVETYPTVLQMTSTVTAELEDGLGADRPDRGHLSPAARSPARPRSGRWRSSHGARGEPARRLLRSDRQACAGRRSRVQCRDPDADAARRARRSPASGSAPASSPTASAGDEWRECLAKGAFVETAAAVRPDRDDALRSARRRRRARPPPRPDEGERRGARFPLRPARGAQRPPGRDLPRRAEPGAAAAVARAARWRSSCARSAPRRTSRSRSRSRRCRSPPTISGFATRPATAPSTTRRAPRRARSRCCSAIRSGFLTEGSFTSLFVERGGRLLTPPLARGLLPGILRARLIDEGRAEEARSGRGRPRRRAS